MRKYLPGVLEIRNVKLERSLLRFTVSVSRPLLSLLVVVLLVLLLVLLVLVLLLLLLLLLLQMLLNMFALLCRADRNEGVRFLS